jgi:hypothetical protein
MAETLKEKRRREAEAKAKPAPLVRSNYVMTDQFTEADIEAEKAEIEAEKLTPPGKRRKIVREVRVDKFTGPRSTVFLTAGVCDICAASMWQEVELDYERFKEDPVMRLRIKQRLAEHVDFLHRASQGKIRTVDEINASKNWSATEQKVLINSAKLAY